MRQEPHNTLLIKLQNYQQENPNRMFIGLKETVEILESGNDNRELTPEFFSKIEFFLNLNFTFFGYRTNNQLVNNVNIDFIKNNNNSQTLISDYVHLILEHKKLLKRFDKFSFCLAISAFIEIINAFSKSENFSFLFSFSINWIFHFPSDFYIFLFL